MFYQPRSIKQALEDWNSGNDSGSDLTKLLSDCISEFKDNNQYRDDIRFLKIWFFYMDFSEDFESVFQKMWESKICVGNSLLYVWYASFLESQGKLYDASMVYQMVEWVKKAHALFLERMSELVSSAQTGYWCTTNAYSGKVALSSLKNSSRNKTIEIGRNDVGGYLSSLCLLYEVPDHRLRRSGWFQVYKAYVSCNPDDVVALKIQKPAFPWEFYMHRQLDQRISDKEVCIPDPPILLLLVASSVYFTLYMPLYQRSSFGLAHRMHLYSDCSILVCDYLANGTLQDEINSFAVIGKSMEEVLCIYYTIEMLYMLETLHGVGIIHGDFKPDNLLIRYARNDFTTDGFCDRSGPWHDQGLCLVDWGRGIDMHLFPDNMEFKGDCRTSGFRCVEMQENRPWTFQVDTYGLCVVVHLMLHNSYMEIEKKLSPEGGYIYQPKSSSKRYWNAELWRNLFTKLLNSGPRANDKKLLQDLRESFQDYMCLDPLLIKKLSGLLVKQRATLGA
ncbi:hypothetical protein ACE6H2_010940 [Prunus campanulata]